MTNFASTLITLAGYMAGEFDNREQAIADPAWYVHLRLWQRPVPLFQQDSICLFAEQANVVNLHQPYRQRLLRLREASQGAVAQVQYYSFKDPAIVKGAGQQPDLLQTLTLDQIEELPGCILNVEQHALSATEYRFTAVAPPDARCCFSYAGETRQVALGFEAQPQEFLSYDKGVEPETGKALWGAIMGPYRFTKRSGDSSFPG